MLRKDNWLKKASLPLFGTILASETKTSWETFCAALTKKVEFHSWTTRGSGRWKLARFEGTPTSFLSVMAIVLRGLVQIPPFLWACLTGRRHLPSLSSDESTLSVNRGKLDGLAWKNCRRLSFSPRYDMRSPILKAKQIVVNSAIGERSLCKMRLKSEKKERKIPVAKAVRYKRHQRLPFSARRRCRKLPFSSFVG